MVWKLLQVMKHLNREEIDQTIRLQNGIREKIILKKEMKVAKVIAVNVVPPMLAPDLSTDESELKYMGQECEKGSVLESTDDNKNRPEPTRE